ncbi:MAG: V-type ATP synthase subunit I, partial [Planctomycetes bacterium]|nr:V-type ATP synthase subunit I [Planctomycetota bacterium]
ALEDSMTFFKLAIALGYLHIMFGLIIAFVHNLRFKRIIDAVCDQLVWLVMLNAIVIYMFGKDFIGESGASIAGKVAMVPAAMIVLFSQRQGGWAGRIGMGCYQLFSTIFYMGDVLSYLRLMALGMVTGGFAMAINVMAKTASDIPYVGIIIMIMVLIIGHLFNTAISGLSAFVHTIRLQFVEFFPKFLEGGGREFKPLTKEYNYIYIKEK